MLARWHLSPNCSSRGRAPDRRSSEGLETPVIVAATCRDQAMVFWSREREIAASSID